MLVKEKDLESYLTDASNLAGGRAEKLFIPENAEEVAEILREAEQQAVPVTAAGARTGTVGGAIPHGGYLISLEKLNQMNISAAYGRGGRARVGAGVILADLQQAVAAEGLFYPPDPTEWSCQIGGTVATNASGARSFKYGSTRDFVERLEITLVGGDTLKLKRGEVISRQGMIELRTEQDRKIRARVPSYPRPPVRKDTSGYFSGDRVDAIDLFIGSEGTLGIITRIELKLLDRPNGFFSGIVFFQDEDNLVDFVSEARDHSFETRRNPKGGPAGRIDATVLEYFDGRSLRFIREKFPETPEGMAGAVFFEQETTEESEDDLHSVWSALLEKHGADIERSWFALSEQDLEKMRRFRHALPVAVNEKIVRYKQRKVGTDMAVPDDKFESFLNFYRQKLDQSGLEYVIFGHIGDGHLHANMIPRNDEEMTRARHLYGRFIAQSIMLGGTVSAEHGIGKLKSKYLYVMYGERYLNEMAELKRAFDPQGLLGRGNMFDEKFIGR